MDIRRGLEFSRTFYRAIGPKRAIMRRMRSKMRKMRSKMRKMRRKMRKLRRKMRKMRKMRSKMRRRIPRGNPNLCKQNSSVATLFRPFAYVRAYVRLVTSLPPWRHFRSHILRTYAISCLRTQYDVTPLRTCAWRHFPALHVTSDPRWGVKYYSHEHITECWYIYWACLWECQYGCLISTLISTRKLCNLVISMLMSILQNVGTYTGRAYENANIGVS
jgi:hypothetical protein